MSDFQTKYEYGKMSFYTNEELLEVINQMAEALRLAISLWPHDDSNEGKIAAESLNNALKLAEPYIRGE